LVGVTGRQDFCECFCDGVHDQSVPFRVRYLVR
jgi:hypothetical protein